MKLCYRPALGGAPLEKARPLPKDAEREKKAQTGGNQLVKCEKEKEQR